MNVTISPHQGKNKEFLRTAQSEANEYGSRVFLVLGVDAKGDIQVFPAPDVDIKKVPAILREFADIMEGTQVNKIRIK